MNKFQETSRQHFNKIASTYETNYEGKIAAALHDTVLRKLDLSVYRSVLDIGCGPGTVLSLISTKTDVELYGIDLSPEMTRIAQDRLGRRADIRLGDSETLPWDDNSFDVIISIASFHHFPAPKKSLSEIHRVIKPEGYLIIADISSFSPLRQLENLLFYISRFLPIYKAGDFRLYSESELCKLLKECKFDSIKWESLRWGKVNLQAHLLRPFVVTAMAKK